VRNNLNKKMFFTSAISVLALLNSSCGGSSDSASDSTAAAPDTEVSTDTVLDTVEARSIAVFVLGSANQFVKALVEGVNEAATSRGNTTVTIFDGAFDPTNQLNQIQTATATGKYDGYIIMPVFAGMLIQAVEEAIAAGIDVVATNNPLGADVDNYEPQIKGVVGSAVEDNRGVGMAIGKMAIRACETDHPKEAVCEVEYLSGGLKLPLEVTKRAGFDEAIKGSNLKVVAEGEAGFSVDLGLTATQDMLQAHPGIDVVVTGGDEMALGAQKAIDDTKLAGTISIIGVGASSQGVEAVKNGDWFGTAAFQPHFEGVTIAKMLLDNLDGIEPADRSIVMQELIPSGYEVNKDNAANFVAEWSI